MPEADLTPFLAISRISDPSSSLEGMIDLWVHGKSLHTQRYYRREAHKFLAMVAKPLELVTLADVQAYVTVLQQISSKQSTRVVPGYRSSQVATVLHQAEIRCIKE